MEDSLVARRLKQSTAGDRMQVDSPERAADSLEPDTHEGVDSVTKDNFQNTATGPVEIAHLPPGRKRVRNLPKVIVSTTDKHNSAVGDLQTSEHETTRLNRLAADTKLKQSEDRRMLLGTSRRHKREFKSQAELIQAALDLEDANTASHHNLLRDEEGRLKRARVSRPIIDEPKLRFLSRAERIEVPDTPARPLWPMPPPVPVEALALKPPSQPNKDLKLKQYISPAHQKAQREVNREARKAGRLVSTTNPAAAPKAALALTPASVAGPSSRPQYPVKPPNWKPPVIPGAPADLYWAPPAHLPADALPIPFVPARTGHTELVAKTYLGVVVQEDLEDEDSNAGGAATWDETMRAVFGTHVDWEEVQVYVEDKSGRKPRPLERVKPLCPITGRYAPYRDPKTGTPFSDVDAYRTLQRVLEHKYIWSDALGMYVGAEDEMDWV